MMVAQKITRNTKKPAGSSAGLTRTRCRAIGTAISDRLWRHVASARQENYRGNIGFTSSCENRNAYWSACCDRPSLSDVPKP